MQKCISQIVHLLLPVEEVKLNNRSTINHDNAHAGTLHWWLVHRHNPFSLTPLLLEILMIIYLLHVLCVLKIQFTNFCAYVFDTVHRYLKSTYMHMLCGHWPGACAGNWCARQMLTCMCAVPLGPAGH